MTIRTFLFLYWNGILLLKQSLALKLYGFSGEAEAPSVEHSPKTSQEKDNGVDSGGWTESLQA